MDLTHYVTLGRSGLRVSPLCLGAMTFGTEWGIGVDPDPSMDLLDRYLDQGGNFIDTANMYNKGHSEAILGDYLAPGGRKAGKRDRIVVATKWLGNMWPGDPNGGGSHRKALMDSFDHSLRRLRTDYIDLLWMHFWDRHTPIEETMRALDDLVRAGKVRYIGFSDTPAWKCAQAQVMAEWKGWTPLIALQIEYSLLERTVEGELLPMAAELGMGVTPWSPLKGGVLSGKYRKGKTPDGARQKADSKHLSDAAYAVVDALDGIAKARGCTVAQAALAWVRQQPGVTSTIIGARSTDQLDANIASLGIALTAEDLAKLNELSKPTLNFPHEFLESVHPGIQNGTTVNDIRGDPWKGGPQSDDERW